MTNTKRITLIGSTGNGKSTLANVLLNKNNDFEEVFKESADSVSETRNIQVEKAEINLDKDGNEKLEMIIIDTVGIGDTQLTTQGVLYRLAEATNHIGEGLNQIFFVSGGRFTEKEEEAYRLLSSVIFDSNVTSFTTIVRTKFPEFESEEACKRDKNKLRNENAKLANISKSMKIIHVDNPPMTGRASAIALAKEIREDSRKVLITYLATCHNIYNPRNLDNLNNRIKDFMTEKELLEKEIVEKERLMKEQEQIMSKKLSEAEERGNKQIRDLEQKKEQQIKEIKQNTDKQIDSLRDQNRSAGYTINQLKSQMNENDGVSSALSSFYGLSEVQGTDFSSKSLAGRVYYLKDEFERVTRDKDYWKEEEEKERERARSAENSRNYWSREETKERERANRAEERVRQLEARVEQARIPETIGRTLFPFF
jgi:GTPase SAR1 family protein